MVKYILAELVFSSSEARQLPIGKIQDYGISFSGSDNFVERFPTVCLIMVVGVVKFSSGGCKIRKMFG